MKTLEAKKRDNSTVREEGMVPAIVYGKGIENLNIWVLAKDVRSIWSDVRDTEAFTLDAEGTSYTVKIQDIQTHAVSGKILHIDFLVQ